MAFGPSAGIFKKLFHNIDLAHFWLFFTRIPADPLHRQGEDEWFRERIAGAFSLGVWSQPEGTASATEERNASHRGQKATPKTNII
ncbi:hypothetical protein JH298_21960 (plasmid) [Xanthomonas campestris pv. campestris]|uniref:hypothetical protein n=1 Tax=Xanthomonas campestris TaxID=339 RepID=UPI001C853072|nr:hypothetical protein [Xanthomonas campestris]MDM7727085.1 hypothetical protein [Xanthomonas campestris pv. campestris]MDM7872846.1 hypothetical protein [Xanthomonas campestris pv. campestris]MEA0618345.1 hypothetical protein [Xanthomonas campestris pv. campestris]MEB1629986.1 hypothetical protein [Xanthomonas campestris pv. campestris]MEB1977546.1 hypothetical protein [Xanthomonas campestris pv. campestris]